MSAEFWAIIGVGVSLATIMLTGQRETNKRLDSMNERLSRLEGRFEELRAWSQQLLDALLRRPAA